MTPTIEAGDLPSLKPCPFCGFAGSDYVGLEHVEAFGSNDHRIRCGRCFATTGSQLTHEAAIAAWNTRSHDPLIRQLVEALDQAEKRLGICMMTNIKDASFIEMKLKPFRAALLAAQAAGVTKP